MPATDVSQCSSMTIAPSLTSTPASSRPRPSLSIRRPTQMSARSASTLLPPSSAAVTPASVASSDSIFVPVWTLIFSFLNAFRRVELTSGSILGSRLSSISTRVTFTPSWAKIEANSQPM